MLLSTPDFTPLRAPPRTPYMLLMTDFAEQGRSSPLGVFSVAGLSEPSSARVPLVGRLRRASTEYMMLGPVWITMRMAE